MSAPRLSTIRGLILDMDGVLWRGKQPIGDLPSIFTRMNQAGLKVTLATNNATLTIDQYVEKIASYGVAVEAWQIVNSPQAAALYLSHHFPEGGPVFVVGESGLVQGLQEKGFDPNEETAVAVVAGMDRGLTYAKLSRAALLIRAGALFIGTNPDRTFPTPEGLLPGAGAILAALETATSVTPVITGKPAPEMYRIALERLGLVPDETLVIGDRLETDIAGAQEIGCRTALVLSGVSTLEQAHQWQPAPDLIAPDLAHVIHQITAKNQS